ncbi:hypothetical protein AYI70_g5587 [Smittium culicis]|uniref:Uncharacterized protein n=1 Tax=Smittium culicis TaxID=133412 RepID=A0A1R1XTS7_9FUNG|nr:hypothetical protein AYI70_g5587 [Smittium culicis]
MSCSSHGHSTWALVLVFKKCDHIRSEIPDSFGKVVSSNFLMYDKIVVLSKLTSDEQPSALQSFKEYNIVNNSFALMSIK